MNGAKALLTTLLQADVEVCFSNPGTSEMHFIAVIDQAPGMRCVFCLFEGDDSAMYTIQALWTMAWQQRDITTLVFANRQVAIMQLEFMRVGAEQLGASAASQMNIGNPDTNTVELANSLAVSASRAERAEEFNQQFQQAMTTPGPQLIAATI